MMRTAHAHKRPRSETKQYLSGEAATLIYCNLLRGSEDSGASFISNSLMSRHSSISSLSHMFAFNKVQSLKPYSGLVEVRAYRVNVSLTCTTTPIFYSLTVSTFGSYVAYAPFL